MLKNITNFISKYYKSIDKEKIVYSIVNIVFAIIIFLIFYTIAKISFNKIKKVDVKKILQEKKETDDLKIPKPNPEDSKAFSKLHRKFLSELIFYVLILIGTIFALNKVGVNMNTFMVILGSIGFGLAFGLQNFVKEIISGIAILIFKYYNLGDLIKVNNDIGYVKKFNLINTTLLFNIT